MKKIFLVILFVLLVSGCASSEINVGSLGEEITELTFADSNLEFAVRNAIDKPEGILYSTDVANLRVLYAGNMNITDITGIEQCKNLKVLSLGWNNITDISPLEGLPGATINAVETDGSIHPFTTLSLGLTGNHISDISCLTKFKDLDRFYLHLGWNPLEDISALAELTNLISLHLEFCGLTDVSCLSGLTNLIHLDLTCNQITDISPLDCLSCDINLQGNPL